MSAVQKLRLSIENLNKRISAINKKYTSTKNIIRKNYYKTQLVQLLKIRRGQQQIMQRLTGVNPVSKKSQSARTTAAKQKEAAARKANRETHIAIKESGKSPSNTPSPAKTPDDWDSPEKEKFRALKEQLERVNKASGKTKKRRPRSTRGTQGKKRRPRSTRGTQGKKRTPRSTRGTQGKKRRPRGTQGKKHR